MNAYHRVNITLDKKIKDDEWLQFAAATILRSLPKKAFVAALPFFGVGVKKSVLELVGAISNPVIPLGKTTFRIICSKESDILKVLHFNHLERCAFYNCSNEGMLEGSEKLIDWEKISFIKPEVSLLGNIEKFIIVEPSSNGIEAFYSYLPSVI